jgi:hypothetical protein
MSTASELVRGYLEALNDGADGPTRARSLLAKDRVQDGRIQSIRVIYDPRPFLALQEDSP